MQISEELKIIQENVRAHTKFLRNFEETGQYELNLGLRKNYDVIDLSEIKNYWLGKLQCKPRYFGIFELANMVEETGWLISHFQKAFLELEQQKLVRNLDKKRKRLKNIVNFEANHGKGELLEKIKNE